ncbi:MAG TPA: radical SAM protein [bacterium]|nr:radical SAM protein [bacterium]
MRVLMVSANRAEINMRTLPLGMMGVAQAAKSAGHEVRLLDLMAADDPLALLDRAIAEFSPEVIGVSLRNIDDQNMRGGRILIDEDREVVARCRELSRAPVVLGGAGYSIFPQSALDYTGADMGIQGEGEAAFVTLLGRLALGRSVEDVPGLYLRGRGRQGERSFLADLDAAPLPGPDLIPAGPPGDDFWFPVQTRRGCPLECSYCSTSAIEGRMIRKRSPAAVISWLKGLRDRGISSFHFVDNTFNLPASYALELCRGMSRAGLAAKWRCILYPGKLDEELAAAMAAAGCAEVSVGFESGSAPILRAMNKRFSPDDARETCALLHQHGIRCLGFLLLGGPGETRDTVLESLAFADSLPLSFLKITIGIRIYPATRLAEQSRQGKIISASDNLLRPAFFLTPGLEPFIRDTVSHWTSTRRHWTAN